MECSVCNTRSSVGYCVECQTLLCEVCSIACEHCGKIVCPEHQNETRSGRRLCGACFSAREAKKAERQAGRGGQGGTGLQDLEGAPAVEEERADATHAVLKESARKPLEPWQLSFYGAIAGVAVTCLILLVPSLRQVPLSGTNSLPTGYIFLLIPLFAIAWGVVALINPKYRRNRSRAVAGIAVAMVAAVLSIIAIRTAPDLNVEIQSYSESQARPEGADEGAVADWREGVLKDFE